MSNAQGNFSSGQAVHRLTERAVLTRAVCRELLDAGGDFTAMRPTIALSLLLQWVKEHCWESIPGEPLPADGLDRMVISDDCGDLLQEIRDGAQVARDLWMLWTADSPYVADMDQARIQADLTAYWARHGPAVPAPFRWRT